MATVSANGIDHHVQFLPAGNGPTTPDTVVFIHGAFIDSLASFYFTLGPRFTEAGFNAVMYDLRGHGRSERPGTGYMLQDFTADLTSLLDALALPEPVHVIGNSFGGTLAFDLAVHHSHRVASITVVESAPATPQWAATMTAALHKATQELPRDQALGWFVTEYGALASTRREDARHRAHIARLGCSAGRLIATTTIAGDIPASRLLADDDIRSLTCPVLLVNGGDGLVADQTTRLAGLLPDCRVAVVPGQKHSVLVEAPDTVGPLILDWVREQAASQGVRKPSE
ncbi:alpha/beta fold hydrolase [Streptomyces sp. NPDC020800]|uniref:alpha/beta fold hydrolase n=1 Tax=Streptomyces sp. NPDC020800 TaxID=3365092 RepID=UPI0037B4DB5D